MYPSEREGVDEDNKTDREGEVRERGREGKNSAAA